MRIFSRNKNIKLLYNIYIKCNIKSERKYSYIIRQCTSFGIKSELYRNLLKVSNITWVWYSDNKKHFINIEKKTVVLKDVIEQRKVQLKDTEHKIRQKGEEIIRDIKHQKKITQQKIREKKDHVIKDILETKEKVKTRLEEVVEVRYFGTTVYIIV